MNDFLVNELNRSPWLKQHYGTWCSKDGGARPWICEYELRLIFKLPAGATAIRVVERPAGGGRVRAEVCDDEILVDERAYGAYPSLRRFLAGPPRHYGIEARTPSGIVTVPLRTKETQ